MRRSIFILIFAITAFAVAKPISKEGRDDGINITVDGKFLRLNGKIIMKTQFADYQDSLVLAPLKDALKETIGKIAEKEDLKAACFLEKDINYDIFYKIMATLGESGVYNIEFLSQPPKRANSFLVVLPKVEYYIDGNTTFAYDLQSDKKFLKYMRKMISEFTNYQNSSEYKNFKKNALKTLSIKKNQNLYLILGITEKYVGIWGRGENLANIFYKNTQNQGKAAPNSAYDELETMLSKIHDRFIDAPDANTVVFLANDNVSFGQLAGFVERAKKAGFVNPPNMAKISSDETESVFSRSSNSSGIIEDFIPIEQRNKDDVAAVVNAKTFNLKNIYNKHLEANPGLSGKIILKFTIDSSGDIIKIGIVSSTTGNSSFDNKIKKAVSLWKWGAIKGGNATITLPFNFTE